MLSLYIDTSAKTFVSGPTGGVALSPSSLPLFYPDTLTLNVYLLAPIQNAPLGTVQYQSVSTAGLQLVMYLDGGPEGSEIYTQAVVWQSDPTQTFFIGQMALNTLNLKLLLGNSVSKQCYLKIGFIENGVSTTLITALVTITAGLPTNPLVVPPGLVPLSVQAAEAMFVPINGLPAGNGFLLISPNGKKILVHAVDNPDGTSSVREDPVN